MALTQERDVTQALSLQAAREALTDGVCPGCSMGCLWSLDSCGDPVDGKTVPGVVLADKIVWPFAETCCIAQLLADPGSAWLPLEVR